MSKHFVFAEDAHTAARTTACGLKAVASESDYWDMEGRTADWATDIAAPIAEGELTCPECATAYEQAHDEASRGGDQ